MVSLFADDIPLPRGHTAIWSSIAVMFASVTYLLFFTEIKVIVQQIMLQLFISFLAGSMIRFCEFLEEYRHIPSRYKNGWMALSASFNLKGYGCGIIMFLLLYCIVYGSEIGHLNLPNSLAWQANICCFCYAFLKVFGFLDPTPAEISEICEKNKLNVAHGLAWSYYIGYLKFVLPNLEEGIKKYRCSDKNLPYYKENWKLYVLIPFSCKIHDKLEKVDDRIEFFGNLPELRIDKAGIKERSYKNSIYTIYDQKDRPHHCILEYATPLRSLFEMSNDASAAFSKEQCLEQAKLFYITLENILDNSHECTGYYRLIPYDDDVEEGNTGSHFLSTTILKHLVQERTEYTVPEETTWDETLTEDQLMISRNDDPQTLQSIIR